MTDPDVSVAPLGIWRQLLIVVMMLAAPTSLLLVADGVYTQTYKDEFSHCADVEGDGDYLTCIDKYRTDNWFERRPGLWLSAAAAATVSAGIGLGLRRSRDE